MKNSLTAFVLSLMTLGMESNRFLVTAEDEGNNEYAAADDVVGTISDDTYIDLSEKDFGQVSVMPISCVD